MYTNPNYPVKKFTFCPACGLKSFVPYNGKALRCNQCGILLYFNSSAAVAAIISNEEGEVLFTVRKSNPAAGMLDLPGGFVDPGETVEEALVREIQEELNLEVCSMNYLNSFANSYHYNEVLYPTCDLVFYCTVKTFNGIKASDDVQAFLFRDPRNVDLQEIGLVSIRAAIQCYIELISDELKTETNDFMPLK